MENDQLSIAAREFVEQMQGSWNHEDWQSFLNYLADKGISVSEDEAGELLEKEKTDFWKRREDESSVSSSDSGNSGSSDALPSEESVSHIDSAIEVAERKEQPASPDTKKGDGLKEKLTSGAKTAKERIGTAYSSIKKMVLDASAKMRKAEKEGIEKLPEAMKDEVISVKEGIANSVNAAPKSEKKGFLKTGISGFDSLLSKGIPKGISLLLVGGPGCGKTTFGLQLLAQAAKRGEKCIYMSFEEKEEQLASHLENFGFDPKRMIADGNLVIKRYDPFIISQSVEALLAEARGELLIKIDKIEQFIPKGFVPDMIVLDSLSAVAAAFAGKKDGYRIYIEQLFRSLERTGATSFLITETSSNLKSYESRVEEFLADGVISFYNIRKGSIRVKALEILKIRGVNFRKKIVPFDIIEGAGLEVYPMEEIFTKKM